MQLLEGCASRGQLLLGLCSTAPSNQPLSELAAGHGKPERTLQPGEGIDRGCELIAGSVMVSEAESRPASYPPGPDVFFKVGPA
jgi:hypothetical protein